MSEERKKLKPVINKNSVVSTKTPLRKKISGAFIKEDIKDVKKFIISDYVIPGIKVGILNALSMIFMGEAMGRWPFDEKSDRSRGYYDRASYSDYYRSRSGYGYDSRDRDREEYRGKLYNEKMDYRNVILRNRDDAEKIIRCMHARIDEAGAVSVAEMFDLLDISTSYTDNNWGWSSHRDIGIKRIPAGYLIDVTEARYIG